MNKLPIDIVEYIALYNIPVYHLLINSVPRLINKHGLHTRAIEHFTVKTVNGYNTKEWYLNKVKHREDGPAVIFSNGEKQWFLNGIRHREDGPAIIYINDDKIWYLNGKKHREDGPTYICSDGYKEWWLNGEIQLK